MSSKWIELAQKNLGPGDGVEKSFSGYCDRKYGYLVLSKKKLLFVTEEGLFTKKYNLVFNIPYEKLKTDTKGNYGLVITEAGGKTYDLTFDISVSTITKSLKEQTTPMN